MKARFALSLAALATILIVISIQMTDSKEPRASNIEAPRAVLSDPTQGEIRRDIEAQTSFQQAKVLTVPKKFRDFQEDYSQYPLIEIMQGKNYLLITEPYAPFNRIDRSAELTSLGRKFIGNYVQEDSDKYSITIARKKIERINHSIRFGPDNRFLAVSFEWTWEPVNDLGQFFRYESGDRLYDTTISGSIEYEQKESRWVAHSSSITDRSRLMLRSSNRETSAR